MNKRHTIYGYSDTRYAVQVFENGQPIHEYRAGNHRYQSDGVVPKDSMSAIDPKNMVWMSKNTAEEVADEWNAGIPELDEDLCDELKEEEEQDFEHEEIDTI